MILLVGLTVASCALATARVALSLATGCYAACRCLRRGCASCSDSDGVCLYPYYGVAPHTCFHKIPGATIGGSVELPDAEWPANFVVDPEDGAARSDRYPRCGTYTHCLDCGAHQ